MKTGWSTWIPILHGNAGNLGTPGRPEHDRQLRDLGLGMLALDYRGYGESQGTPTEVGLYADARAAWDYLTEVRRVAARRIVIYGTPSAPQWRSSWPPACRPRD